LRYPDFTVANPLKGHVRVPLYYMTDADQEFEEFLQNWLELKRASGTYQELYDFWILGEDPKSNKPRWCILRDVLAWAQ
jgi:ABC-type amino acid transport substrate-binding protein